MPKGAVDYVAELSWETVGEWTDASPMSYELYANSLEAVAALVQESSADVVT